MRTKTVKLPRGIYWHPSTESPGKKRVVGAFIEKGRDEKKISMEVFAYLESGHHPCETAFHNGKRLCIAWAEYKEVIKGITPKMIAAAKDGAWAWWNKEEEDK